MFVFIGMETSGVMRRAFAALGHRVISCDLLPAEDDVRQVVGLGDLRPMVGENPVASIHVVGDVFEVLNHLWATGVGWPNLAIFHPDCTYLTSSAEWAFKDPDFDRYPGVGYHQKLNPGTLFGAARREAREAAKNQFRNIAHLKIKTKVVENPRGALSQIRKPGQTVNPYQFGDDASKATCLWFFGENGEDLSDHLKIPIDPVKRFPGRMAFDKNLGRLAERWSNQTDQGQNRLPPSDSRWQARAKTYDGIAKALAAHLHEVLSP